MHPDHDILDGLTAPQTEAVTHKDGPLLVIAGAGSGKTRIITRRVAWLARQGVEPYRILAVTFTNKAAGEMRERIEQLAGTRGAWVSTFHSLCAVMLRMSADMVGMARNFSIYDRTDQLNVVKEAMKRLDIGTGLLQPANVLNTISNAKNELKTPADMEGEALGYRDEMVARIYTVYQRTLEENAALDFDDLLCHVARLLDSHEEFALRWQQRFQYLLVDEYQDTNHAQYLIARRLAAAHKNLCATGDPNQSIYGWRGADIRNILNFERDYPKALVVKLEQNYRSTKTILRAANSVIRHNGQRHEHVMWTENDEGVPLTFRLADDADEEAVLVCDTMAERKEAGARCGDMAVFYRTNAQSRLFEETLVRRSIPYRLVGAVEFYGRQEIKDLLAYLRVIVNERDDLSLARIINTPTRGIGARTVAALRQHAEEHGTSLWEAAVAAGDIESLGARAENAVAGFVQMVRAFRGGPLRPVSEVAERVVEKSGMAKWLAAADNAERAENVGEFITKATIFDMENPESDLAAFLQEVSLVSDVDNLDRSGDTVTLMTLHAAKGLEFPLVFLTGMEEGTIPHANSMGTEHEIEEERRLCYVGVTRAQKELVLSAARERPSYATSWTREPSRFLLELDRETLDERGREALDAFGLSDSFFGFERHDEPAFEKPRQRRPPRRASAPKETYVSPAGSANGFAVGDRVLHEKFGEGLIESLHQSGGMTLATITLTAGGKRVFALEMAPLKKL
jgi:DNA helicase-2/ATP-dependent DNA helicase PcrA